MDRGHPQLASKIDGMNPAVLSLIGATADAAHKEKIMAGVCGGTASDIQAVPILIGLGVTELSVSIPVIPAVKSLIRKLSISDCKKLAAKAVEASSAKEVRKLTPTPLAAQIQLGSTTKRSNQ
jgi:phosphocarrier protein FPr